MKRLTLDEIGHFILVCVYTLCPPFYMMALTYLLSAYRGVNHFILSHIIPIFWGTIWIPAVCSFITCWLLNILQKKQDVRSKTIKDYPLIFIFFYSVYFILLGRLSWGSDCMYGGVSGVLLVFFAYLFQDNLKKCVVYLPVSEKVYAYMVVFLFPIFVLAITDMVAFWQQDTLSMVILIAPIGYVSGLSFFLLGCLALRCWCVYYGLSLKKNAYTLPQLILFSLIGNNMMFLYLIPYVGNMIFIIGLIMSTLLCLVEYSYHLKWRKKK